MESEIGVVDNNGVFHAEYEDRRPAQLIWPTDRAAKVMIKAIYRRRREYVFTGHGVIGGWLGRHTPDLVHLLVTRGRR